MFRYEHHTEPLAPRPRWRRRLANTAAVAGAVVAGALGIGILGYHVFGGLDWIDALLEASMILSGMGPVRPPTTAVGKLFSSFYALFSGLVFIGTAGILVAPWIHRLLHRLHAESRDDRGA